jgi:hypothetical protein
LLDVLPYGVELIPQPLRFRLKRQPFLLQLSSGGVSAAKIALESFLLGLGGAAHLSQSILQSLMFRILLVAERLAGFAGSIMLTPEFLGLLLCARRQFGVSLTLLV